MSKKRGRESFFAPEKKGTGVFFFAGLFFGLLSGPTSRPDGVFKAETFGHPLTPELVAEGSPALDALSQSIQFSPRLGPVYASRPVAWNLNGPLTQQ